MAGARFELHFARLARPDISPAAPFLGRTGYQI
jgi:hypothetical protein